MLPAGAASPPEAFQRLLEARAPAFGLLLSEPAVARLSRFLARLDDARRQTNLTGPLSIEELADHALESVLGERLLPPRAEVVDIGSGAGFPGIPIAIVRPDLGLTPIEPRRKRSAFLDAVSREIGVENVFAPEANVNNLPGNSVDAALARAVGKVDEILGEARFLKSGGLFLAWTTTSNVAALTRRLAPFFSAEEPLPVPESRHKVIAPFRKTVPRGTQE